MIGALFGIGVVILICVVSVASPLLTPQWATVIEEALSDKPGSEISPEAFTVRTMILSMVRNHDRGWFERAKDFERRFYPPSA